MNKLIIIIASILTLTACATMIRGTKQHISINTTPVGAKVTLSNGQTCVTPCNIEVERKNSLNLNIEKENCQIHTTSLIPTLGGAGVVLGGLIDYGTGAVYDLQPNPLHVNLVCNRS